MTPALVKQLGIRRLLIPMSLGICLLFTGCKEQLYTNLDEQEANRILAVLMRSGIEADRVSIEDGKYAISVEQSRIADVVDVLDRHGLPQKKFARMDEVFEGDSFVLSQTEERARFVFAVSEELSRTLTEMEEVVAARVHIALPSEGLLEVGEGEATASAFIRHHHDTDLTALTPKLKELIANSVEGLRYENISIIMAPLPAGAPIRKPSLPADNSGILSLSSALLLTPIFLLVASFVIWFSRNNKTRNVTGMLGLTASKDAETVFAEPIEIRRGSVSQPREA